MIRLGDIRFLNSWPVTYALRQGLVTERVPGLSLAPIKIVPGSPAQLNCKLLTGELDASAVSTILYLRHAEELVPIPGLCIRSDGGVFSVLVVSREPLERLGGKRIGVSNQGATTPVLLRILLRQQGLSMNLEFTSLRYPEILQEFPAALLIGDEALEASQSGQGWVTWDLAQAWARWTRLPCVFALWVIRRRLVEENPELLKELSQALTASAEWGKNHSRELMAQMRKVAPFEATFLKKYLVALSYDLDSRAWAGLRRFAEEAQKIGELPRGAARRLRRPVIASPALAGRSNPISGDTMLNFLERE